MNDDILVLADRAWKNLPLIKEKFPENVSLKFTEYNLELARRLPYALIFMLDMDFYSKDALATYLKTIQSENHSSKAEERVKQKYAHWDLDKLTDDQRSKLNETLVDYTLEEQAKSYTRYFSLAMRQYAKHKGQHINTMRMRASTTQKFHEIISDLKKNRRDKEIAEENELKKEVELKKIQRAELIDWFKCASVRDDYIEEFQKATSLQNQEVDCVDII